MTEDKKLCKTSAPPLPPRPSQHRKNTSDHVSIGWKPSSREREKGLKRDQLFRKQSPGHCQSLFRVNHIQRLRFSWRVRDWVFCTLFFMHRSENTSGPFEALLNLLLFSLSFFSALNRSSLWAVHHSAVFGEGLCLESTVRASGALYLSTAVRARSCLAPLPFANLSLMNYCRRSKLQIYDVNVYAAHWSSSRHLFIHR